MAGAKPGRFSGTMYGGRRAAKGNRTVRGEAKDNLNNARILGCMLRGRQQEGALGGRG